MKPRPVCVHCGAAYGQRWTETETVCWALSEPKPAYQGNLVHLYDKGEFQTVAKQMTCQRYLWDGDRYFGGSPPFCTLRCALDYARKSFKKYGRLK